MPTPRQPLPPSRKDGVVSYLGNVEPEKIVIDYKAIQSAPKRLKHRGSLADIYSCKTGLFDWQLSHKQTGEAWHAKAAADARKY